MVIIFICKITMLISVGNKFVFQFAMIARSFKWVGVGMPLKVQFTFQVD
jgi:hypothetical protein